MNCRGRHKAKGAASFRHNRTKQDVALLLRHPVFVSSFFIINTFLSELSKKLHYLQTFRNQEKEFACNRLSHKMRSNIARKYNFLNNIFQKLNWFDIDRYIVLNCQHDLADILPTVEDIVRSFGFGDGKHLVYCGLDLSRLYFRVNVTNYTRKYFRLNLGGA